MVPLLSACTAQTVYQKVYTSFVEALDGIDNGIAAYPASAGAPLYKSRTDLSSRVAKLNPEWNEEGNVDLNERFFKAVALTGSELAQEVKFYASSWLPARQIVLDSLAARFAVHASGAILRLDTFTLWKNHLLDLEVEQGIPGQILYVLYAEAAPGSAAAAASAAPSNKWRIQCVPESEQSFESRKALPEPWRGVRDDALSALTGIPGGVFVHASGFIGGATSYEAALKMAVASLETPSNKKQKV